MRLTSGSRIANRYEVVKELGRGTVGTVVHVLDNALDRQSLALKVLHGELINDDTILQRFHNEVMLARQLSHPHIVRVYDFEQHGSYLFLSMEYVIGCDLDEILNSYTGRKMPCEEALFVLSQVAEGLSFAHQKNVVHRDLKPQNILIDHSGVAKITDFGIAHGLESSLGLTKTGQAPGTPAYMAPEQFVGAEPDPRMDVYAFGVLAFELLSGKLPFLGDNFYATGERHRSAPLPVELLHAEEVPKWLEELICDCTAKDSSKRIPSMREIAGRLNDRSNPADSRSKTILKTVVRKQQRSNSLISPVNQRKLRVALPLVIIGVFLWVVNDINSQQRLAVHLNHIELVAGYDTSFLRARLGFNRFSVLSTNDLIACVKHGTLDELEVLLAGGANKYARDENGDTFLHHGARNSLEKLNLGLDQDTTLIERTVRINMRNHKGETPLLVALKAGRLSHARTLLSAGASIAYRDKENTAPLLWAASLGDYEMVLLLISAHTTAQHLDRNQRTTEGGLTAVHLAADSNKIAILELLLNNLFEKDARDLSGQSPLMRVVQKPAIKEARETFHFLLKYRASLTARDDQGWTVLDHALANSDPYWKTQLALLSSSPEA